MVVAWLLALMSAVAGTADPPIEFPLSRFGSGTTLDPCPQHHGIRFSAAGLPDGEAAEAVVGVAISRWTWVLPFTSGHAPMSAIEQEILPTGTRYTGRTPARTVELSWTIRSPFYPGDARISTAPFFFLDFEIRNTGRRARPCRFRLDLPFLAGAQVEAAAGGAFHALRGRDPSGRAPVVLAWGAGVERLRDPEAAGVALKCDLGVRQVRRFSFVLATHRAAAVLRVGDTPYRFRYTEWFADVDDVVEWALANRAEILRKSDRFDETVLRTGMPKEASKLVSLAFQTFCAHTTWCVAPDGREWFGIWDAAEQGFNPVSALLDQAPFLLQYWPEVFEMALFADPGAAHAVVFEDRVAPPDRGIDGGNQDTLLEAADRILLLREWVRSRGIADRLSPSRLGSLRSSVEQLLRSDTNRNGLPDSGPLAPETSPMPPSMRVPDSLVIGCRVLAALAAAEPLLRQAGDEACLRDVEECIDRILVSMESAGWSGECYRIVPGKPGGSPLLLGGLLSSLRWSDDAVCPAPERIVSDQDALLRDQKHRLGCRLGPREASVRISSNLVRDMVSAHVGQHPGDRLRAYWMEQVERNSDPESNGPGGYFDLVDADGALPSSRGVVAFALARALAGFRERTCGAITHARNTGALGIPILSRADWDTERVLWIRFRQESGDWIVSFHQRALLGDRFRLSPRQPDPPAREIRLQLEAGVAPRLLSGAVIVEEADYRETAWIALLRGEPGGPYVLRCAGLPPGEFNIRAGGEGLGRHPADRIEQGIPFPGVAPGALPRLARVRLADLRDRMSDLAGNEPPGPLAARLAEVGALASKRLAHGRAGLRFRVEVRPASRAGQPVSAEPRAAVPRPGQSIEAAVVSLFALAARQPDARGTQRLIGGLRPIEVGLAVEASPAGVAGLDGRLVVRNHFLPRLDAEVVLEPDPGFVVRTDGPLSLEGLGAGEERIFAVRLLEQGETQPVVATLGYWIRSSFEGVEIDVGGRIPIGNGRLRSWLVSRVYTGGDSADFVRSEAAEWDPEPAPSSGDANWRHRVFADGAVGIGRTLRISGNLTYYAHTYLHAREPCTVEITGESSGRLRIWINARQYLPVPGSLHDGGPYRFRAGLDAGWNRILLKAEEGVTGWGATLRVEGAESMLEGLSVSALPPTR